MVESLALHHFRNYTTARFEFDPRVNILLGQNGQGKTNLLEALSLLLSGDSFRYGDNETFVQRGNPQALLRARCKQNGLDYELQLEILKSRKNLLLNQKRVSAGDLPTLFHFVVFSPESLVAIKEGADQRRQLVDELLVSTGRSNAHLIRDFRRALKTRNRILKDHAEGKTPPMETAALLESLNPSFFRLASSLTQARIEALRDIQAPLTNAMQNISGNGQPARLEYVISNQNASSWSLDEIENALRKRASELRDAELASGASLVGPQKHDIIFLYNENDSRFYCSQGQQRALILSFKMAQIVYHRKAHGADPILMLDDVLSELDEQKRESLIHFLQEIRTQILMTTTDLKITGDLASHDCRVMEIVDGQIRSGKGAG